VFLGFVFGAVVKILAAKLTPNQLVSPSSPLNGFDPPLGLRRKLACRVLLLQLPVKLECLTRISQPLMTLSSLQQSGGSPMWIGILIDGLQIGLERFGVTFLDKPRFADSPLGLGCGFRFAD
jgi:hypothetical protein